MRHSQVGELGRRFSRFTAALAAALVVMAGCGDSTPMTAPAARPDVGALLAIGTDPVTGATIETNKDDYTPGEVVHLTGRGWAPNETVHLLMTEDPDTHGDVTQDVVADAAGAFNLHFYDVQTHDVGSLFTLTATGGTSGSRAVVQFTDGVISSATIEAREGTCATAQASFPAGSTVCASANLVIANPGSTNYQIRWQKPDGTLAATTGGSSPNGTTSAIFNPTLVVNDAGTWTIRICDTNSGTGGAACPGASLRASATFSVTAAPTNTAPTLNAVGNKSIDEGSTLTFTATASDGDTPAQTLAFSLVGGPAGASITTGGAFSWTPTDGPAQTATFVVKVTDNGSTPLSDEESITVTVNNVAPTGTFNAPSSVALNAPFTISITAPVDPSTVDVAAGFQYAFDCGSGTYGAYGTASSTSCTATATGSVTVRGKVKDKDGGETEYTQSVAVNNVAPLSDAGGPYTGNEGSAIPLAGTGSDPDGGSVTYLWTIAPNDGICTIAAPTSATTSVTCSDNGTWTLDLQVTDDETASVSSQAQLTVANVAPSTPVISAPASVNESPVAFSFSASSTDPSTADVAAGLQYAFSCDDGTSFAAYSTSASATCPATDGPATVKLAVKARDKDGGESAVAKQSVTVANVAPTVTLSGPTTANEGATISYSYTFTDPGADGWTRTVSCGANGVLSADVFTPASKSGSFDCTWADNHASQTVSAKVDDDDGGTDTDSKAVTVANVAPVVTLTGPTTATEGETKSYSYTFTDPGADSWTRTVSCGANGVLSADVFTPASKSGSFDCTWPDNYASQTVSATVNDDDAGSGTDTQAVTVSNVAPAITGVSASPLVAGNIYPITQAVTVKALFTDPGTSDTHSCAAVASAVAIPSVTGTTGSGTSASGQCSSILTFASPAVYDVVMTVTDDDGGSDTETIQVVVYDPSAGFVTGGGWINAPAGSYPADPSLSGKGTFGFVSKYLKGATTPTGNTQFVFHANGFNFSSTTYQFLVVNQNGTNAQFKGTGTVNNAGAYTFMLWATDGPTDKFRIKIWDTNTNVVVFDNLLGASDGTVQDIGSGSIVIHTGGKSK